MTRPLGQSQPGTRGAAAPLGRLIPWKLLASRAPGFSDDRAEHGKEGREPFRPGV